MEVFVTLLVFGGLVIGHRWWRASDGPTAFRCPHCASRLQSTDATVLHLECTSCRITYVRIGGELHDLREVPQARWITRGGTPPQDPPR